MKKYLIVLACSAAAFICSLNAHAQTISTIAGIGLSGFGGDGGPATAARVNNACQIAADAAGNIYFADRSNHRIRKINTAGVISTVAGTGFAGYGGDGGPAISAQLNAPYGIAVDAAGNLYIGDAFNQRVRRVTTSGIITTVAGTGIGGYSGDGGAATAAQLYNPMFLHVDNTGNIYVCDNQSHRIRKITAGGIISTIAGNGLVGYTGDGGPATAARVRNPNGIWADNSGNVFISQPENHVVRKVDASGIITTIAGTGTGGYTGDGGPATSAGRKYPHQLYLDASGDLYIADAQNNRIRKVSPSGIISTIAGTGVAGFLGDGGPATAARLNNCPGVYLDNVGRICIVDQSNQRVRRITLNNIPFFTAGSEGSLTICVNEMPISTDALLAVSDADMGQTLTWNVVTPPLHGILSASYSATSTGGTVTPSGTSYMASAGYSGSDMFQVQVFDGIAYDTITVTVTVSYVPTSGAISGADSVCVGNSVTLSGSVSGGAWSDVVAGVATVGASGIVSGATPGIDTVVYTVTNTCGSAMAKKPIKVLPLANAGVISGIDSLCPGKTITLSETVTGGTWSTVFTGITTVSTTGVVSGTTPGVDTIVYSVTNSCGTAKAKRVVKVLSPSICQKMQLEVAALAGKDACSIYPNPSNGKFNILISSPNSEQATINITDITGKKLKEFTIQTNSSTDLEMDLQSGVYLLNLTTDSIKQTRKITITQ